MPTGSNRKGAQFFRLEKLNSFHQYAHITYKTKNLIYKVR